MRRPFVALNMAALPANLIEAELFGAERGAYTDSRESRIGKFESAEGGDIFFDEIGDMPHELQAKLLRVLQERQVQRVGSNMTRKVDCRVIAATNRTLSDLADPTRFREDLFYRIGEVIIEIPPLRERREDIPELCRYFLRKHSHRYHPPELSVDALEKLVNYDWPGNVRQLEATIKGGLIFHEGSLIRNVEIIELKSRRAEPKEEGLSLEAHLLQCEKKFLEKTLQKYGGDCSAAMRELQIPRSTFYRRLRQFAIAT